MQALITNYYLISAMAAWLLAQFLKIFTGFFKEQRFSLKALFFGTGGMPSSHTATVASLCTACAIGQGFDSAVFAISVVLAIIVMIDAMGVRRETGKQSRALNIIIEELFKSDGNTFDTRFKELIGHTPLQVVFGFITGVITAIALSFVPAFDISFL
ncbi:MAG: divergent PAP2 family protein [Ruminococcaceae bacterium]|nr:divergent PAP2 family protein [Oscillospiraceae bacterium]